MVKRFVLVAVLLVTTLCLTPSVMAQEPIYREGAFLNIEFGACGIQGGGYNIVMLNANKIVDRANRTKVSSLDLYLTKGIKPANLVYVLIGPDTVTVPGDADNLSVSRDLGWAGLDTSVQVYDAATQTTVTADLHVAWFAKSGVINDGGFYKRLATVSGTITVGSYNFLLPACVKDGYIFSTREPKPLY